ncbi:HEPN domain-containing protein [Rickettsia australis]|uniref:HEPN domain-containing protein n=1 Tax=Rickettsia australis TaxID=787 RepID=UPI000317D939|nr:HEPN domain-containing protein [Rickettsia australis]
MQEIAKDYYEEWFDFGVGFFINSTNNLERKSLRHSAFYLHQATESFYSSILLVFFNYKPKLYDIKKLGSRAANYNSELLQVCPMATPKQKECFKLLLDACVKARCDKSYKINKAQLLY